MHNFTPAQMEAFTGLTVGTQRAWRMNGHFQGRGSQTDGGHWRFCSADVLFVEVVKRVAEMGCDLGTAARVADLCLGEVVAAIRGNGPLFPIEQSHPFVFVWRLSDTQPARELDGIGAMEGSDFAVMRLADLRRIPEISRSGGMIFIPADLARKVSQPVRDLFREAVE